MTRYILVLVIAAPVAVAQGPIPDTVAAHRYAPIAIGNEWHYEDWRSPDIGPVQLFAYETLAVVGDSLVAGESCVVTERRRFSPAGAQLSTEIALVRFDDAIENIVGCTDQWSWITYYYRSPCPLSADFYSEVECGDNLPPHEVGGGPATISIGGDQVEVSLKGWVMMGGEATYEHASDIGFVRYEHGYLWTAYLRLRYARVGESEYGAPAPVSSEPEAQAMPTTTLSLYPNPASARVTVRIALEQSDALRLDVFDLLGRQVKQRDLGVLPIGEHEVQLDVQRLPTGVYIVRLTGAAGARATVRVTKATSA